MSDAAPLTKAGNAFIFQYVRKYWKFFAVGLTALVLVDVTEVFPAIFLKQAVDVATGDRPFALLKWVALGYLGVAFLQALGRYGWRIFLTRASMEAGRDLRDRFAEHVFGLGQSFFDRTPIGEMMSLVTSDVEAVRMSLGVGLLTMADALFYFLSIPVAMFLLSPKLTLLAFIPLPIVPWLVMRNEREVHERYEKTQEQFSKISAMVQESLNGIRVLKAFAQEDTQAGRLRREGESLVALSLRLTRVQAAFGPMLDFIMSLGLVLLLFVGGNEMIRSSSQGAITLGTFVAFQRYIQKMVWPMAALGVAISYYQRALTSARRLQDVFDQKTDVPQSELARVPRAGESGRVEFRELCFRFPGSHRAVLDRISLMIEPGERVALIGRVGSGKSALLSLLPRVYPAERGMAFVDGIDVNDWNVDDLRRRIGYVSQDLFLFSETVLENLAYGLASWSGSAGEVAHLEEHAGIASVHRDILSLPGAYRTRVGERGVTLSGGQKQRLTIARATAMRPEILILDDALSSVDVKTESEILKGLRKRPDRNTEIIAAHRISTVQDADRIYVLESGKIIQSGTHRELVAQKSGLYFKFHEQQRLQAELESYSEGLHDSLR